MIFRRWLASGELEPVLDAVRAKFNAPQPEAEIRRVLAWFPSEALVRWFLRGDGLRAGEVEFLTLEDAMKWRRETLKRDLPSPLSSGDRFLPLIRMPEGFLIFDGRSGGLALRRTKRPENYVDALKTPIFLHELTAERPPPRVPVEPEEEEPEEPERAVVPRSRRDDHFRALGWWTERPLDAAAMNALLDDALAREWFSRIGPETRRVDAVKFWSLTDALIARDELEERASVALTSHLHHLGWMPLGALENGDQLVYWAHHGVRFHRANEGRVALAPWSRLVSLDVFLEALTKPQPREEPELIADALFGVAATWDEDPPENAVVAGDLALEAWFSCAPATPFREAGETVAKQAPAVNGAVQLLDGADGVSTWLREGGGVVLRVNELEVPWAASLTEWTYALNTAADARTLPGINVVRNFVGHFTIELPFLPFEFARQLESMGERLDLLEFAVERAGETTLHVERLTPVLKLDAEGSEELIAALDAQREPMLRWEPLGTTFVFKPLK
ncbi:MAG: hypothetical protein QM817_18950 [Archangium sp.]